MTYGDTTYSFLVLEDDEFFASGECPTLNAAIAEAEHYALQCGNVTVKYFEQREIIELA